MTEPSEQLAIAIVTAFMAYGENLRLNSTGLAEAKQELHNVIVEGLRTNPVELVQSLAGLSAILLGEAAALHRSSIACYWRHFLLDLANAPG